MAVKLRQRNGKWWAFIDYKGQRKAKCVGSKHAAEQFKTKLEAKIALGQFEITDEKPRRPFDSYFRNWLDTYARAHCKPSTVYVYEEAFRLYLLPAFQQKDISKVTREEVKTLIYGLLTKGKSRSTANTILAPLRAMFSHVVEDAHVDRNPCLRIMRRSRKEEGAQQQTAKFLTREELGLLLRTCQEHFPQWYPFVSLLARTGLRIGEACALQWGDLDFNSRFLEVRRNLVHHRLPTPKNGKTRRVDLSLQLGETLKALLLERKKETLRPIVFGTKYAHGRQHACNTRLLDSRKPRLDAASPGNARSVAKPRKTSIWHYPTTIVPNTIALRHGWGEVPVWVFMNRACQPEDPDTFRGRVWPKLLDKAKLRHIRIHDLRHTFASLLIQNGESLAYVKEQMGHHSIKITVDTYGHLMPGGNKAAVDKLDGLETATVRNPDATNDLNAVSKRGRSA